MTLTVIFIHSTEIIIYKSHEIIMYNGFSFGKFFNTGCIPTTDAQAGDSFKPYKKLWEIIEKNTNFVVSFGTSVGTFDENKSGSNSLVRLKHYNISIILCRSRYLYLNKHYLNRPNVFNLMIKICSKWRTNG